MSDLISRQAALAEFVDGIDVYDIMESIESLQSADRPTVDKEYLIDLIQEAVYDGEACAKLMDMVDRPTGEWVEVEDYNGDIHYQCDQCGEEFILIDGTPEDNNYWHCPNCGSYNREVRKNED